jgi:hypothetical protein
VKALVLAGLAGATLLGATGAAPRALTQAPATDTAPALQDLGGVADLRALFDADRDKVRIVLLLSPT